MIIISSQEQQQSARYNKIIKMENKIDCYDATCDLNKNGAFFERRKMYPLFALHNLKSSIPIQWTNQQQYQQQNRLLQKQKMEHQYIKREYNNKIERQLNRRYNQNLSTFRVLMQDYNHPNKLKDKEILQHELENFNTSKDLSTSIHKANPQHQEDNSSKVIPSDRQILNDQSYKREKYNQELDQFNSPYKNYASQEKYSNQQKDNYENRNVPYLYRNRYSNDLPKNYKKYPDLYQGNGVEFYQYPFKNLMPDKLQQFLRQNTKLDNKRNFASKGRLSNHKRQKSL